MSHDEAYALAVAAERDKLFAAGLPLVYEDEALGHQTVCEYADGRREIIRWDETAGELVVVGPAPRS